MRKILPLALLLILLCPARGTAASFEDDAHIYQLYEENGSLMTQIAQRVYPGDEYISEGDRLYEIIEVDDTKRRAVAKDMGAEPQDAAYVSADKSRESAKKLICMYSTHSDESYIEGDGAQSKSKNAGIYDVGDALKAHLEQKGWAVEYSKRTSLPHDAGAYRRSRAIAAELAKRQPKALLDIHRDGIPDPESYETTVDGDEMTKVRLFVGKNNPNAAQNRALAKRIKSHADSRYKGLIKDIFIGKGNYNQELYPNSLLLELGTHTSDKDKVKKSTALLADVLNNVLSGTAHAEGSDADPRPALSGVLTLIVVLTIGGLIFALAQTGTLKHIGDKLGRGISELSGGLIGKHSDHRHKE